MLFFFSMFFFSVAGFAGAVSTVFLARPLGFFGASVGAVSAIAGCCCSSSTSMAAAAAFLLSGTLATAGLAAAAAAALPAAALAGGLVGFFAGNPVSAALARARVIRFGGESGMAIMMTWTRR
jgi:hypothetical protein